MIRIAALAAVLVAATPAGAQHGAMWVDDVGRMMSLGFAGPTAPPPSPTSLEPTAMTALFKDVCVAGGARTGDVATAALARSLEPQPFEFGGKNAPVATIYIGAGAVVSQADSFLGSKGAQCNATFYVDPLPEKDAVVAAVTAALGTPPSNADKAIDKKGKPNGGWTPQWTVLGKDGTPLTATAFVVRGSNYMPGSRVQLSLYAAKQKAR